MKFSRGVIVSAGFVAMTPKILKPYVELVWADRNTGTNPITLAYWHQSSLCMTEHYIGDVLST